jgi:hypothetical protein
LPVTIAERPAYAPVTTLNGRALPRAWGKAYLDKSKHTTCKHAEAFSGGC